MTKKNIQVEIIGGNAESVTGSCTLIKTQEHSYLFELGMIQDGHTTLDNYILNSKLIHKIKIKDIDYIIISHLHADHIGLIPSLYENEKCKAKIIVPKGSKSIMREMLLDSSYIMKRDIDILNKKSNKKYTPLYTDNGVYNALNNIMEIESNEIIKISDELSIRYINAGHILLSKQAELFIGSDSHKKKILFTGDLGNVATQNSRIFVEKFEPIVSSNIVIGECTYSAKDRECTSKTYKKDIEKIKSVIQQYCVDNHKRVLIPSFSLDRTPYILWILYNLFGNDDNFDIPILVDSPLTNRLLDCYSSILTEEAKENFDKVMSWKNIHRVITPEDSKEAVSDNKSKVVLSSSGMLTAGRSVKWVQNILPNPDDCILFLGYCGENTLGYKIKHERDNKTISINGKPYKNKANIVGLNSFSSHMQRSDLISYYSSINCEKIYLVHSNNDSKLEFKEDLQNAIADCLKSTRIMAVNKGMKITI